nr:hypothetical protein [uncultured bacterium]
MYAPVIIGILLICAGLWIMGYRNRPEELSQILPIRAKYRKHRLHPLFAKRQDVIAFSAWVLIPGVLLIAIYLYRVLT